MPDTSITAVAPSVSVVQSGTDASHLAASTWYPSGKNLEGWLIFVLALPGSLTKATLKGSDMEIPQRVVIPVVNGTFDQYPGILYNASIEPPNTQYGVYFVSEDGTQYNLNTDAVTPVALVTVSTPITFLQFQVTEPAAASVSWPTL